MANDCYIIWSIEHDAWWNWGERGYVNSRAAAGHYSFDRAIQIVQSGNYACHDINKPNEAMILLAPHEHQMLHNFCHACAEGEGVTAGPMPGPHHAITCDKWSLN